MFLPLFAFVFWILIDYLERLCGEIDPDVRFNKLELLIYSVSLLSLCPTRSLLAVAGFSSDGIPSESYNSTDAMEEPTLMMGKLPWSIWFLEVLISRFCLRFVGFRILGDEFLFWRSIMSYSCLVAMKRDRYGLKSDFYSAELNSFI